MKIDVRGMYYRDLNDIIAGSEDKEIVLDNVGGQRYIGSALSKYNITINGTPGNALAAYMNDSTVTVNGSAQDAAGDTMNAGRVIIHGRCGDTCGYAMRGGEIYIRDDAGYRTGIHMKEYKQMKPVIVLGGCAGDFLGEYLAGGLIVVLGLGAEGSPVGMFCGTGMHGGVIYIRASEAPWDLPRQVKAEKAEEADLAVIRSYAENYCAYFGGEKPEWPLEKIMAADFLKLTPNSSSPYKQLYVNN